MAIEGKNGYFNGVETIYGHTVKMVMTGSRTIYTISINDIVIFELSWEWGYNWKKENIVFELPDVYIGTVIKIIDMLNHPSLSRDFVNVRP